MGFLSLDFSVAIVRILEQEAVPLSVPFGFKVFSGLTRKDETPFSSDCSSNMSLRRISIPPWGAKLSSGKLMIFVR